MKVGYVLGFANESVLIIVKRVKVRGRGFALGSLYLLTTCHYDSDLAARA